MIRTISLLALFVIALLSCKQETSAPPEPEVESVAVEVPKKNEVYISVHDTLKHFFSNLNHDIWQDKPDMLLLGKDEGRSSLIIPTKDEVQIRGINPFYGYNYTVDLMKGDSVEVEIHPVTLGSKTIDAAIFNIPNSSRPWHEINYDYLRFRKNVETGAIPAIKTRINIDEEQMYQNSIALLDSLLEKGHISDAFHQSKTSYHDFLIATRRMYKNQQKYKTSEAMQLDHPLDSLSLKKNSDYLLYLRRVLEYKYFPEEKRVSPSVAFDYIVDNPTFLHAELKEYVLESYLMTTHYLEPNKVGSYIDRYLAQASDPELIIKWTDRKVALQAENDALNKANLNVGHLTSIVGGEPTTFEDVLARYKGNVVLVDFWASWCSPCRQEIPFTKELLKHYSSDKLKVVSIATDKTTKAWKRASEIEGLSDDADNYHISNWGESNLYKTYKITSIPRYLLFDKAGKIILDDAPRPSDPKLKALIDQHLK